MEEEEDGAEDAIAMIKEKRVIDVSRIAVRLDDLNMADAYEDGCQINGKELEEEVHKKPYFLVY